MIKISNPRGLEGALNVLTHFKSELRSTLGQTAFVQSTTGGLAVIRKPCQRRIGLLLQLVVGQNLVELKTRKLRQSKLDPNFSATILAVSEKIVQKLLANHSQNSA
jgi:DhnA family fructose-bisphosphate aldolase class Ia